jgi:hypothetical protein
VDRYGFRSRRNNLPGGSYLIRRSPQQKWRWQVAINPTALKGTIVSGRRTGVTEGWT